MKIKFNLGWILAVAAALVLAAMGFMSFYYMNGGKPLWGIIVAVCLLVIPVIVCLQLVKAKGCSRPFYFHDAAVTEMIMLGVVLVVLVGAMAATNHFFTVNSRAKQIQEVVGNQRAQLEGMTTDYRDYVANRVSNYKSTLETVRNNRVGNEQLYDHLFGNDTTAKVGFMTDRLNGNLSIPRQKDTIPDVMSNETLRWWQLPSVMNNVDEITSALQNRYDFLVERAKNDTADMTLLREYGNEHPSLGITVPEYWSYSYSSASDIMNHFTEPKGFISNIWAVICGLVGVLLIMLPYFVTERDGRSMGLWKEFQRKESEDDPEENDNIGTL